MNKVPIYFDNIIFSLQKAGGISVVWYEILKRAFNDQDIEPIFLEYPNDNIFRGLLEIPQKKIIISSSRFPVSIQRYINPKIKNEFGIFHSSYYRTSNSSNFLNVTTVHDFTYEYYRKGLARYVHSRQKENAIRNSFGIICISENTKKDLLNFYPNVNEQKVYVVYNGVSDAFQQVDSKKHLNIIPFEKYEYALYVGDRSSRYKNFYLAVNSCKKSLTPLLLVGGGPLSKYESTFLKESLKESNYKHLSGIDNDTLNILYNNALCLLYTSLYEGFGIPVVEAQKAGCPVIAANCSSIPEIVGPVSTILKDPTVDKVSDMINQLKSNSDFTKRQVEIGLKNSCRFSWDKCYEQTKEIYKELFNEYFLA